MMVPLPWVDEQTGFYEPPDFHDPSKTKKFSVVPIRFICACKNGHMGDIDWRDLVHRAGPTVPATSGSTTWEPRAS